MCNAFPEPAVTTHDVPGVENARAEAFKQALLTGSRYSSVAPTGSMRPVIDEKTFVVEQPYKRGQKLKPGEVIIFTPKDDPKKRIVHMVSVAEDGGNYRTTGVNNRRSDGWVNESQIQSVVKEVYRFEPPPKGPVNM
jgi:hypothetical protein